MILRYPILGLLTAILAALLYLVHVEQRREAEVRKQQEEILETRRALRRLAIPVPDVEQKK